jgi:uncharacterized protein (DUF1501 family)
MNRRDFLKLASVASLSALFPGTNAWAFSNGKDDDSTKKLIVILLRGGMDGLNVVAPYGDREYYDLRPKIAIPAPGSQLGLLDLDGHFGLHPALQPLMPFWQNHSLAFMHASGSPDQTRSHFDAQDYMESGVPGNKTIGSGWLNRLAAQLPVSESALRAISIGAVLPRMCAGPATIATVSPATGGNANNSVLDRPRVEAVFKDLYAGNGDLSKAFAEGLEAHKEVQEAMALDPDDSMESMAAEQKIANKGAPSARSFTGFGKQLSQLFHRTPSMQIAFLDLGGWDTHVNQGTGKGQLANHLAPLGQGLADLASGLGEKYKDTIIVVQSEFGRTARENGNGGTDHGHGNVMLLLGGPVPGGKVWGRWGGLAPNALHEQRDLPTTTDFRSVLAAVLSDHMNLDSRTLAKIFPGFQPNGNPFVRP